MYQYYISKHFKKQLKTYIKKNPKLLDDVINSLKSFKKERSTSLGANTYKLRISASDFPRGKSRAFRIIILLIETDNLIAPIVIYFKGKRSSVSKKEIIYHAKIIKKEIDEI